MHHWNAETERWENAGHIEWLSNFRGSVYFGGVERVRTLCLPVLVRVPSSTESDGPCAFSFAGVIPRTTKTEEVV